MSTRRSFLAGLIGAAAVAVDPERAGWVLGKKVYSIPRPSYIIGVDWGYPSLDSTAIFMKSRQVGMTMITSMWNDPEE